MSELVYINGQIISSQAATVSAYDHGLLYGHGLFETLPIYNRRIFRLTAHLDRLAKGASQLGWLAIPDQDNLAAAVNSVLTANDLVNGGIRLSIYRGPGTLSPDDASCGNPVVIIAPRQTPQTSKHTPTEWALSVSSIRRNDTSPLSRIKSTNYLDNILARKRAQSLGANEALLINTKGFVAEGSISNLFFITRAGELITPDINSGILPGITRSVVLALAKKEGLSVIERPLSPAEFPTFSEAFATNSLIEIKPVTTIDKLSISCGAGPITRLLQAKYWELVTEETT